MKMLILCDRESTSHNSWDLCSQVQSTVQETGIDVDTVVLNGDDIKHCMGCYMCWVRTPGYCIITNDCANGVGKQEIQADIVLFLTKITYGGYSYDLKSFIDRSIPNISPYFEIIEDNMRHGMRYEWFPNIISLGYGANTPEERQTFIDLVKRNSLIMMPQKHFVFTMESTDEVGETMLSLKNILQQELGT